jgi:alkylated DNA repair dioxygenase AlkB
MIIQDAGIDLEYRENFLPYAEAVEWFEELKSDLLWEQKHVRTPRGPILMPRLVSWYANSPEMKYKYSGALHNANPWNKTLLKIKAIVEAEFGSFNSALCNFYRSSKDSVSAHADDEKEMKPNHDIVSVSLGSMRDFVIKHNHNKHRYDIALAHGSALIMKGRTQEVSKHSIPKSKIPCGERINITFRQYQI